MKNHWYNTLHHRRAVCATALLLLVALPAIGCSETAVVRPAAQTDRFLSPEEAYALIQENMDTKDFVIIDDRGTGDFAQSHIENAINIPVERFNAGIAGMDKNKTYLVYCATGCGASSTAMLESGFRYVYEIRGGFNAWKSQGLPVV